MKYQKDVFERFKRPWTFTEKKDLFNKLLNQGSSLLTTTHTPYHFQSQHPIIKLMASFNTWSSKWCISTNYLFLTGTILKKRHAGRKLEIELSDYSYKRWVDYLTIDLFFDMRHKTWSQQKGGSYQNIHWWWRSCLCLSSRLYLHDFVKNSKRQTDIWNVAFT